MHVAGRVGLEATSLLIGAINLFLGADPSQPEGLSWGPTHTPLYWRLHFLHAFWDTFKPVHKQKSKPYSNYTFTKWSEFYFQREQLLYKFFTQCVSFLMYINSVNIPWRYCSLAPDHCNELSYMMFLLLICLFLHLFLKVHVDYNLNTWNKVYVFLTKYVIFEKCIWSFELSESCNLVDVKCSLLMCVLDLGDCLRLGWLQKCLKIRQPWSPPHHFTINIKYRHVTHNVICSIFTIL